MPLSSLFKASPSKKTDALRVAVLGAGRMGQFHLKALRQNPLAQVVAIVDADPKKAPFQSISDIPVPFDAAIVATPTPTHFTLAKELLRAGVSCLVEKPLASNVDEAEKLIALAKEKNAVLQVGHIERFNPAILEALRHIKNPQFIEVNRLGPYDPRVAGIGVVLDLMIHDLDIVQFLVGKSVEKVEAFGAKVLSEHEDIAKVRLQFEGGCVADLSASRISLEKYRRIRVFQKDAYLSLDYAAPHLKIYRKKSAVVKSLRDIEIVKPRLSTQDPLSLELNHFLDCVKARKEPWVSGHHGRSALELAHRVLTHLRVHE